MKNIKKLLPVPFIVHLVLGVVSDVMVFAVFPKRNGIPCAF